MAKSKPKGIADDIVGGVRNIVSPWLGAPAGQNRSVTQAQGLARAAAETLDQTFAGGMVKAGVQGNKALAKQAAVNAAALATGYVAGKVTQKVVQRFSQDIGLHVSTNQKIKDNISYAANRANTGFRDTPDSPIVAGKTYKISGYYSNRNFPRLLPNLGKLAKPGDMAGSAYSLGETANKKTTTYITQSKTGKVDPELMNYRDRVTGNQQILQQVNLPKNPKLKEIELFETKVIKAIKTERQKITNAQNLKALRAGFVAIPVVNLKKR